MNLGQRLKHLRMRRKLSMEELADKLNEMYPNAEGPKFFGKGKISKWESSKVDPSVSAIAKVAKFFDVSLDYLLGLEEKNTRYPVVEVPILDNVNKNEEMYNPDNIVGYYYIPNNLKLSHQKLIYLRSQDHDDDRFSENKQMLLINLEAEVKDDEVGLFITNDNDKAIIRRLQVIGERFMLIPQDINSKNRPRIYNPEDIKVVGKLVSSISYSVNDLDFNK